MDYPYNDQEREQDNDRNCRELATFILIIIGITVFYIIFKK